MTVGDWVTSRSTEAPPALVRAILHALAPAAQAPEEQTAEACLGAAARCLEDIVTQRRFTRDHALDLLVADGLTTLAFEHASASARSPEALGELARAGAATLARLAT